MSNQSTKSQNEAVSEKTFAEGDLGRVQGLLFGDQFDAINARIDSLEAILLESISAVRSEMRKEITGTQRKIDRNKANIDKRLDTKIEKEAAARKTAVLDLSQHASDGSAELKTELERKAIAFDSSLDALRAATDKALATTRSSLEKQIQTAEQKLSSSKLDRSTLADLLTQTADQISAEKTGPKRIERAA